MINVSANASAAINADSRRFRARFLLDGKVIDGSIKHITVNKGSCGDAEFVSGALYSSFIDAVVDYCPIALERKELLLQFGVLVGDDYEWSDIGYFTVVDPATSAYTTSFSAIGRLSSKAGNLYVSALSYPTTIQSILKEISDQIGVTIDVSEFNTSEVINTKPSGYMHREVLGYIAGLFFGYVTETADGHIRFGKFCTENVVETDGDRTTLLPTFADLDTEVTGVSVTTSVPNKDGSVTEQVFTSGVVSVAVENPFMTQALFDANVGNIIGFKYRSGSVPITMGDYRLEESDCMRVTDIMQHTYLVPCMHVQHVFDGGMTTYITAPTFTSEDDASQFKGALAQRVERYEADLIAAKQIIAQKISADEVTALIGGFDYVTTKELDAAKARINVLESTSLKAENLSAEVAKLGYATVSALEAATARIQVLESTTVKASELEAKVGAFGYLKAENAKVTYATLEKLNATDANVTNLQADVAAINKAIIDVVHVGDLTAINGNIDTLKSKVATIEAAYMDKAKVDTLIASKGYITEAQVETLVAGKGYITSLETKNILANYATIDLANVKAGSITSAMIGDGVIGTAQIADGSITDAKIIGLTANKITAGKLDAAEIEVVNLNAANITVGTINGKQIESGAIDMSKLSDDLNETIANTEQDVKKALEDAGFASETVANLEERANNGEFKGEDGIVLRIDSSRGTVFKNNTVSTVLCAVIYKGSKRITDIEALHEEFGSSAYIEWKWQRIGETSFGTILSTDSRIGNDGFTFTLSPDDVDTKVVFLCNLITD